ncbi:hypothetical protein HYC85_030051 [Camellia sinensis]|uniref:Uncharacterized protein n=1 Tax=Camellia sinensis TaxID=4442 RepID=A0A7J7FZK5_CAMSI|nr:hypothetical protein HYC85_030051 [Camellia sinensis]
MPESIKLEIPGSQTDNKGSVHSKSQVFAELDPEPPGHVSRIALQGQLRYVSLAVVWPFECSRVAVGSAPTWPNIGPK